MHIVNGEKIKPRPSDGLRSRGDVLNVYWYLRKNWYQGHYYGLVWLIGCNTGLRVSDVLNLRIRDVKGHEHMRVVESKTGKERVIRINDMCQLALSPVKPFWRIQEDDGYLTASAKTYERFCKKTMHKVLRHAMRNMGYQGNYGTHTMRKTFAYHAYEITGCDETVQQLLNHADRHTTRVYLPNYGSVRKRPVRMSDDEVYLALALRYQGGKVSRGVIDFREDMNE